MKNVIEQIGSLDKQTAKDLKLIIESSYLNIHDLVQDTDEQSRIFEILDSICLAAKDRVKELAMLEIENN